MLCVILHAFLTCLWRAYIHVLKLVWERDNFSLDIFLHFFNCVRIWSVNVLLYGSPYVNVTWVLEDGGGGACWPQTKTRNSVPQTLPSKHPRILLLYEQWWSLARKMHASIFLLVSCSTIGWNICSMYLSELNLTLVLEYSVWGQ